MKKLLVAILLAVVSFGLIACSPAGEYRYGVGYRRVHGDHYLGVAEIVVDKDGKVVTVDFEEYFLPYNAAQIGTVGTVSEDVLNANDVIIAGDPTKANTKVYAKYFKVKSLLFTGSWTSGDPVYKTADGIDLNDWVDQEENAKAYVEAVENKEIFIATAAGQRHATYKASGNAGISFAKSASGYWAPSADRPLGWGGNMRALKLALIGTDFSIEQGHQNENDATDKYWYLGDSKTGATVTDFNDYYDLARLAYNNAIAK
jgi:hypothetical protein